MDKNCFLDTFSLKTAFSSVFFAKIMCPGCSVVSYGVLWCPMVSRGNQMPGLIPSSVRRTVSVVDVVEMLLGVLLECCLTLSF